MTITHIPGRRLTTGESFYTDWINRGGDSLLLRGDLLKLVGSCEVRLYVETREEPGETASALSPTHPPSLSYMELSLSSSSIETGLYEAGASTGMQGQVRLKVACEGGNTGDYAVARVFSPVFFDNSRP